MLRCAQHDKAGSSYRALARREGSPGLLIVAELPKLHYHSDWYIITLKGCTKSQAARFCL